MRQRLDIARRPSLPLLTPRLLPMTVFCLGTLLVVKSVSLVRAATAGAAPEAAPVLVPSTAHAASQSLAVPSAVSPSAGQESAVAAPAEPAAVASIAAPPISDSERAVLLELRQRRQELEAREQAQAAREAVLAAADKKLSTRVEELKTLQVRLEALEAGRRDRDEVSWRGLVKVYETMKPREAAAIMNDLDLPVLLAVLDRMKEAKAAPILAAMQPDKARQVTADLAQQRQRANAINRTGG